MPDASGRLGQSRTTQRQLGPTVLKFHNFERLDQEVNTQQILRGQFDWINGRGHMRVIFLTGVGVLFGAYTFTKRNGHPAFPHAVVVFANANNSEAFINFASRKSSIQTYMGDGSISLFTMLGISANASNNTLIINDFPTALDEEIQAPSSPRPPSPIDIRPPRVA